MKIVILLILIGCSSLLNASDFNRNNGIVSDSGANLEWQDNYSDNNGTIPQIPWNDAINYCEALKLGGKSDWKLPNLNELASLLDDSKYKPNINILFQNTKSDDYWSSTTTAEYHTYAWVVYFAGVAHSDSYKNSNNYVRCVRVKK